MPAARSCFLVLAIAGIGFVALTLQRLPARMATHFDLYGRPNGWSSQGMYAGLLAVIGLLVPLGIVGLTRWLGTSRPQALNVPNRDYWFHPDRQAEGIRRLENQMWWLACLMLALVVAVHALVLAAHTSVPPRLPNGPFLLVLAGFVLGVIGCLVGLNAALRVPPRA